MPVNTVYITIKAVQIQTVIKGQQCEVINSAGIKMKFRCARAPSPAVMHHFGARSDSPEWTCK